MSKETASRTLRALRDELLEAARVYAYESDGGPNPLAAGARLRLSAKAFAMAERECSAEARASAPLPVLTVRQGARRGPQDPTFGRYDMDDCDIVRGGGR